MVTFSDIHLHNGKVLESKKIEELVEGIINKFSEEKLSYDEGKKILEYVELILGEYAAIEKV